MKNEDQGLSAEAVMEYSCLRCGRPLNEEGRCPCCSKPRTPEEVELSERLMALDGEGVRQLTHERTHQTLKWAGIVIVLGALLLALYGCGNGSPLSSTEIGHPNEEMIVSWSQCYYAYFGLEEKLHGSLTVAFTDERRVVPCPSHMQNPPKECIAAGWAAPGTRLIHYYRPWVRSNDRNAWDLQYTAAHEVCHLSGIFIDEQIPDRPEQLTAPQCAALVTQHSRVTGECNDGSQG